MGLQEARLDQLDLPCALRDLETVFRPRVRAALDSLIEDAPDACIEAIMDVATQVARDEQKGEDHSELPPGIGSGLVLHFHLRSKQLWQLLGDEVIPIAARFALIKLCVLACMRNTWISEASFEKSVFNYRTRINDVACIEVRSCEHVKSWKSVLARVLQTPQIITLLRNFAFALIWAGYVLPGRGKIADQVLGGHVREGREQFNRLKQDGLRVLSAMRSFWVGSQGEE